MEVSFATSKLQKIFNSEKKLRGEYGPQMAVIIQQRMNELVVVENLGVMRSIVGAGCHELSQDRKGYLAVNLKHPYRLVFKPDQKPIPRKPDGGLDWDQVVSVEITEVVDYH
jgi:toxin HigB-1